MPAPIPAALPFCETSALARAISSETSRLVCSESCRMSSATDASVCVPAGCGEAFALVSAIRSPCGRLGAARVPCDQRRDAGRGGGGAQRDGQPADRLRALLLLLRAAADRAQALAGLLERLAGAAKRRGLLRGLRPAGRLAHRVAAREGGAAEALPDLVVVGDALDEVGDRGACHVVSSTP